MSKKYTLDPVQKIANGFLAALTKVGLGAGYRWILDVPGRRSGALRSTVVDVMNIDGERWLVAPYGETNWVRNVRAHPDVTLRRGKSAEAFVARPETGDGATKAIREYLRRVPITASYWNVGADSPDREIEIDQALHPVFHLESSAARS